MDGKEASEGRCGTPSDERADTARRADGPVPPGAGGGFRRSALTSLAGLPGPPSVGRLVLLARRHARAPVLPAARLFAPRPFVSLMGVPPCSRMADSGHYTP